MGAFITSADLADFVTVSNAKLTAMIEDAEADATRVAPCLAQLEQLIPDSGQRTTVLAQVKSILRGAIVRWAEAGSGAMQSQTAGPFAMTVDTRQQRRGMFFPSEISALEGICKSITGGQQRAFNIDQLGSTAGGNHQPWCSTTWGWPCSCGANLTRGEHPLWEGGLIS